MRKKKFTGKWLSTGEVAGHLGIGTHTLYRMINEGEINAYRIGRVIRLKRADLDEYYERKVE